MSNGPTRRTSERSLKTEGTVTGMLRYDSDANVSDIVFTGWTGTYEEGRQAALERMWDLRGLVPAGKRQEVAQRVFRLLVTVGEESGDMRFVHLAVETRDVLVYGLVVEEGPAKLR